MFYLAGAAASNALDLISSLQQALGGGNAATSTDNFANATTGGTATTPPTTTTTGTATAPAAPLSPTTLNALFSLQGQGQQPLLMVNGDALSQQMFSLLDTNGDGSISQTEFDAAFGQNGNTAQANSLFDQISNGSGSINLQQLTNALDGEDQSGTQGVTPGSDTQGAQHHHHHHGGGGFDIANLLGGASADNGGAGASAGAGAGAGANGSTSGDTTQTVTNADGSSTTTITYADGSQVTMTIPAANGANSTSGGNSGAGSVASLNNFIEQMIQRQAQMLASATAGQSVAVTA